MKCEHLDMHSSGTVESITAHITFDSFDQSMRFLDILINFIREEKANAPVLPLDQAATGHQDAPTASALGASAVSNGTGGIHE